MPHYYAAVETDSDGEMALAIAHMGDRGPVLDEVKVMPVTGGETGIDAVYRGLRAQGIEVKDCSAPGRERVGDVRERAIASAHHAEPPA
jgi:hypothetical protein